MSIQNVATGFYYTNSSLLFALGALNVFFLAKHWKEAPSYAKRSIYIKSLILFGAAALISSLYGLTLLLTYLPPIGTLVYQTIFKILFSSGLWA